MPSHKHPTQRRASRVAQMVEPLLSKHEAKFKLQDHTPPNNNNVKKMLKKDGGK
jgi:hypothetical protein